MRFISLLKKKKKRIRHVKPAKRHLEVKIEKKVVDIAVKNSMRM